MQVHLKLEFSESENIIFKYIIKKKIIGLHSQYFNYKKTA